VVDDSAVFERPQIVEFFLANILVRRETENSVRVAAQALRLVKGQELEQSALVLGQLKLQLDIARGALKRLDTGVVLPDESLQLRRAVSQLGRSFRENFLGVRLVHVVGLGFASV